MILGCVGDCGGAWRDKKDVLMVFYWELFRLILIVGVIAINFFAIKKLMREYRYFSNKIKNWKNR